MPELMENIKHLYFEEKLSYRQVAKHLGVSNSTVAKRIRIMGGGRTPQEGAVLRSSPEYSEKLRVTQLGENNSSAKLSTESVLAIREEYPNLLGSFTKTQAQYLLATEYGVKRPTISDIVLRNTWKHI